MFFNNVDRRIIYVILAALAISSFMSMSSEQQLDLLLMLPAVVIAMTFHEFAHAYAADRLGDKTPRSQGRVTLNPISHIDPYGFVLLMFANIGWGKPVEINPNNFTSNKSRNACEAIVAVAGPLMNIFLAIIFTIIGCALVRFLPVVAYNKILSSFIRETIWVNIALGVFNLLPIPPLDGSKIFATVLPYNIKRWIQEKYLIIYFVFIVLWVTGILSAITAPVVSLLYTLIIKGVTYLFALI